MNVSLFKQKPGDVRWLDEDECAANKVYLYRGPQGQTMHSGYSSMQWQETMLDLMPDIHSYFWKQLLKCLPPPSTEYSIDLLLAEDVSTIDNKVKLVNEKFNCNYNSVYIWQGIRLAKDVYLRVYWKGTDYKLQKEKEVACRPYMHADGLPFYPKVVKILGLDKTILPKIKKQWMTLTMTNPRWNHCDLRTFLLEY